MRVSDVVALSGESDLKQSKARLLAEVVQPLTQGRHRCIHALFARSRAGAGRCSGLVRQTRGRAACWAIVDAE